MDNKSTISNEGLIEGIGLELKPYGPSSGQSGNSPMQPQDGQWTLRFNYSDKTKLSVFVTVSFGPPFVPTADLYADMDAAAVKNLRDWLTGIITAMAPPPSPPVPPVPPVPPNPPPP